MGPYSTDGGCWCAFALGKWADALIVQLADADELLDVFVTSGKGIIDDDAEEMLEDLLALLDHLGALVGLFPKMGARELGQLQLHK